MILSSWAIKWQIKFDTQKCKVILLGKKPSKFCIQSNIFQTIYYHSGKRFQGLNRWSAQCLVMVKKQEIEERNNMTECSYIDPSAS